MGHNNYSIWAKLMSQLRLLAAHAFKTAVGVEQPVNEETDPVLPADSTGQHESQASPGSLGNVSGTSTDTVRH